MTGIRPGPFTTFYITGMTERLRDGAQTERCTRYMEMKLTGVEVRTIHSCPMVEITSLI